MRVESKLNHLANQAPLYPVTVIAYLAPELPALSATFVYEELLALERRGLSVRALAVRPAAAPVAGQQALTDRTHVCTTASP